MQQQMNTNFYISQVSLNNLLMSSYYVLPNLILCLYIWDFKMILPAANFVSMRHVLEAPRGTPPNESRKTRLPSQNIRIEFLSSVK
jgi:hypothetical protein